MATLKMGSTTVLTDTTLANAVQDNVTRLGTVTSGNLSNTAIVYPAGHIIQFKKAASSANETSATQSDYVEIFGDTSITPYKTGSRIISITNIAAINMITDATNTVRFRLTDGSGNQRVLLSTHMLYATHGSASEPGRFHASWTSDLGTSTTEGTAFPVNVEFMCGNGTGTVQVNTDGDTSNLWLMEVAA